MDDEIDEVKSWVHAAEDGIRSKSGSICGLQNDGLTNSNDRKLSDKEPTEQNIEAISCRADAQNGMVIPELESRMGSTRNNSYWDITSDQIFLQPAAVGANPANLVPKKALAKMNGRFVRFCWENEAIVLDMLKNVYAQLRKEWVDGEEELLEITVKDDDLKAFVHVGPEGKMEANGVYEISEKQQKVELASGIKEKTGKKDSSAMAVDKPFAAQNSEKEQPAAEVVDQFRDISEFEGTKITRLGLFNPANLGNLYNALNDNFCTNKELGIQKLAQNSKIGKKKDDKLEKYIFSEKMGASEEKFLEIGSEGWAEGMKPILGEEQKNSILAGLTQIGGQFSPLGQFLQNTMKIDGNLVETQSRAEYFGIVKILPKMKVGLNLNESKVREKVVKHLEMAEGNATHFVESICFGTAMAGIFQLKNLQTDNSNFDFGALKKLILMRIRQFSLTSEQEAFLAKMSDFVSVQLFAHPDSPISEFIDKQMTLQNGLDLFVQMSKMAMADGSKMSKLKGISAATFGLFGQPISYEMLPLAAIYPNKQKTLPPPILDDSSFAPKLTHLTHEMCLFRANVVKFEQMMADYPDCYTKTEFKQVQQFCRRFHVLRQINEKNISEWVLDQRKKQLKIDEMSFGEDEEGNLEEMMEEEEEEEEEDILANSVASLRHYCDQIAILHNHGPGPRIERSQQLKTQGVLFIGSSGDRAPEELLTAQVPLFVLFFNPAKAMLVDFNTEPNYLQSLGQLYKLANRGKRCFFLDLELATSDSFDGNGPSPFLNNSILNEMFGTASTPQFIWEIAQNGGSRLVKMLKQKVLVEDCVQDEVRKLGICIARIENTDRIIKCGGPSIDEKQFPCHLPCPSSIALGGKCPDNENVWGCEDCGQTLFFIKEDETPITHFYCQCGKVPAEELSFRCHNAQMHGENFVQFPSKQIFATELKRLHCKGDTNILVLGESGAGKSTLINAFVNYLHHSTLDDALQTEKIEWLIPSRFITNYYDENGDLMRKEVFLGETCGAERLEAAKSQTKEPKAYILTSKAGTKIRLIDTPGIGDTDGQEEDKKNFAKTLNYIKEIPDIHAICIILRPSCPKLSVIFRYCISELLTYLHRNAAKNIIFVFTNTRGSQYGPGLTQEPLMKLLSTLKEQRGIDIRLNRNNTLFCMDNEAFCSLCLMKMADVKYSKEEMGNLAKSWTKAENECQRMLKRICEMEPHRTSETISLNEAHRLIVGLSEPLALIAQQIQSNMSRINDLKGKIDGELPKLQTVELRPLGFPRTVCTADCCTSVVRGPEGDTKLYNKHCHPHCGLDSVVPGTHPNPTLKGCFAMRGCENCQICGCSWSKHMHIRHEQTLIQQTIDPELLKNVQDDQKTLSDLEKMRNLLLDERAKIYSKAAQFSSFLKRFAIKAYNDGVESYLEHSKHEYERLVEESKGQSDHEHHKRKLEETKKCLEIYHQQKELIEQSIEDGTLTHVTAQDVKNCFDDLCNLPMFGASFRQMMDAQEQARAACLSNYSETIGEKYKPKPTKNTEIIRSEIDVFLSKLESEAKKVCYKTTRHIVGQCEQQQPKHYGGGGSPGIVAYAKQKVAQIIGYNNADYRNYSGDYGAANQQCPQNYYPQHAYQPQGHYSSNSAHQYAGNAANGTEYVVYGHQHQYGHHQPHSAAAGPSYSIYSTTGHVNNDGYGRHFQSTSSASLSNSSRGGSYQQRPTTEHWTYPADKTKSTKMHRKLN